MLTPNDARSLQNARLTPNAKSGLGAIVEARPVVLGRFTFATYTSIPTGQVSLCTVVFPAGVLQPGDQFHIEVGGAASNNAVVGAALGAIVTLSQAGVGSQNIGIAAGFGTTAGSLIAWRSNIIFGVNVPGADGQYIRSISATSSPSGLTQQPRNLPNMSIGFAGVGDTYITDSNSTAGIYAGGHVIAGTSSSVMLATKSQIAFSNQAPIQMDVILSAGSSSPNVTIIVQSGTFVGL